MSNVVNLYVHGGFLIIGCVLFIIVERLTHPTRSWQLATPYFFAAALAVVASGIAASGGNYPYEFAAALSFGTGALLAWVGTNYWLKALVIVLLAVQMNSLLDWSSHEYISALKEKFAVHEEVTRLAAIVRDSPDPVLADEYMGLLPLYGRRIYFQPFEFKHMQEASLWDEKPLVASIQQAKFSIILLYEPRTRNAIVERWTPELREAIYANYRLDQTLAETFVYVPRSR